MFLDPQHRLKLTVFPASVPAQKRGSGSTNLSEVGDLFTFQEGQGVLQELLVSQSGLHGGVDQVQHGGHAALSQAHRALAHLHLTNNFYTLQQSHHCVQCTYEVRTSILYTLFIAAYKIKQNKELDCCKIVCTNSFSFSDPQYTTAAVICKRYPPAVISTQAKVTNLTIDERQELLVSPAQDILQSTWVRN